MDDLNVGGAGLGTGTDPQVGGADGQAAPSQGLGQAQQGQSGALGTQPAYQLPQKFQGKTAEDIARSYSELEKKLGRMPQMEQELQQWKQFGQTWDPYLRHFEYKPQALVQALQQAAQRAQAQGNPQQAQQLQAQASKAYAELIDPREQEQWIKDHVQGQVTPVQEQMRGGFQQMMQVGQDYINRYMDLALRAIQAKFENPKLDLGQYLQEAVNYASGQYDPMDLARQRLTNRPEEIEAQVRADERKRVMAEMQNQNMTTFVGAGASARSLRPRGAKPTAHAVVPGGSPDLSVARDKFARDMARKYPGTS